MNEERLPQWARLQPSVGSPRRIAAQFEEEHQRSSTMNGSSSSASGGGAGCSHAPPFQNPFVSSSEYKSMQSQLVEDYFGDNLLLIYCRQGLWDQALDRCETHLHEARPTTTLLKSDFFEPEETWSFLQQSKSQNKKTIYEPTPLGILCDSSELNQGLPETLEALVVALCQTEEPQVSANQKTAGNTPLRQAIRNPICPLIVIETLLKQPDAIVALQQADEHGIYPLDHLLQRVRRQASHEVGKSVLQSFLRYAPLQQLSQSLCYSPLVRFYATVSSEFSGLQQSWRHQLSVPTCGAVAASSSLDRNDTVVWVTRMISDAMPSLLTIPSASTGCMPIHAALRNYGSNAALMEVLLASHNNISNNNNTHPWRCMLHRNCFGDLPLHIASACGVPLPVLRLVLARTVQATAKNRHEVPAVLWSTNHAGYTPIDLEWIRHIEAGNGFLSQGVYQPMGVEGIPRPRGRYDDLYDKLLRQAVNQLITSKTARQRTVETTFSQDIFGLLLHRIFLITRATFHDSFSQSPFDLSGDILHQAAALFQPRGPSMPEAIMDLLLWQYPKQIHQQDHLGRTPLHHAVYVYTSCTEISERKSLAWERWVSKLLVKSQANTGKADHRGRYPLHAALEGYRDDKDDISSTTVPCQEFHNIVFELAKAFPEALQICDPVSHLFPAMQAACHPLVPIDTVYWLLRRAPRVLS
mmetsp:Transcript_2890/g.5707  ORF Transcript_2890/g.5707 Transcript_2890/m.5707 type:complete len:696 (-) Transcript_2890:59-2146(-)